MTFRLDSCIIDKKNTFFAEFCVRCAVSFRLDLCIIAMKKYGICCTNCGERYLSLNFVCDARLFSILLDDV